MAGYDDHIPLKTMEKSDPSSTTANIVIKKRSKLSLFFKTFFTFIISAIFTILLLVLFFLADGKSIDYTIAGLKVPSLVSFLLSVNLIFIASGISTAVSEYKWVVLKDGAKLSLVDVYDDCTRGLSGFSKALKLWYFDWVLIVAFIFHVGLLLVNPASQEILKTVSYNQTVGHSNQIVFTYARAWDIAGRSPVQISAMPPKMNGLSTNGYLTAYSFAQAANAAKTVPSFGCPNRALECRFANVSYIATTMTCQTVTENETAIVNRGGTTPTVVVLKEYFSTVNATLGGAKVPKFLYASEMLNRTYWDLANYTAPLMPGLNIPEIFANETHYDPQYRPYVGDQAFVMAYFQGNEIIDAGVNYTQLSFKKCHFNSSLVNSTWVTNNGTLVKTEQDASVTPIVFDYDNVLGNNLALHIDRINKTSTSIMVNAYLMQQALLAELIVPKYNTLSDYLQTYRFGKGYNGTLDTIFESFMDRAVRYFDYAFFQSPYVDKSYTVAYSQNGEAVFAMPPIYRVDKASCLIFCLSLFLPMVWWFVVWALSIARMGGVGRGNSQVALLSMSLTPDADMALRGLSLLDGDDAFKHAKDIRVRLGVVNQPINNPFVACGLQHETHLSSLQS